MRLITFTMLSGALAFATSLLSSNAAHAGTAGDARAERSVDARAVPSNDVGALKLDDGRPDLSKCDEIDLDACEIADGDVFCGSQYVHHADYEACLEAADGEIGTAASAATAGGSGCASCSLTPEGLVPGGAATWAVVAAGVALVVARRRAQKK